MRISVLLQAAVHSAKEVIADHVEADASSGASIQISAVSSVKAEASSGGSVDFAKKEILKTSLKKKVAVEVINILNKSILGFFLSLPQ
jgi:hypothetical protein